MDHCPGSKKDIGQLIVMLLHCCSLYTPLTSPTFTYIFKIEKDSLYFKYIYGGHEFTSSLNLAKGKESFTVLSYQSNPKGSCLHDTSLGDSLRDEHTLIFGVYLLWDLIPSLKESEFGETLIDFYNSHLLERYFQNDLCFKCNLSPKFGSDYTPMSLTRCRCYFIRREFYIWQTFLIHLKTDFNEFETPWRSCNNIYYNENMSKVQINGYDLFVLCSLFKKNLPYENRSSVSQKKRFLLFK